MMDVCECVYEDAWGETEREREYDSQHATRRGKKVNANDMKIEHPRMKQKATNVEVKS